MGVVYLARDPRLDRAVAIKVIPDAFASDPERLARFEREARLLAALHHPNVAGIYGIEEDAGRRFLVLEYVEGETLAERLDSGALPVDEALDVCRQIAAGLEAAHDQGIVHRDLKPGNVKLTPGGEVKVLDFGLAKGDAAGSSASNVNLSNSPTLTVGATGVGVILGTAAYMSPEQARGRAMDRRTDIWALGCVLYECLTGRQAFAGETTSDMIARILQGEPEWNALPGRTPDRLRELLGRMLEKDPRKRLRDAGDVRLELEGIHAALTSSSGSGFAAPSQGLRPRWPGWLLPVAALVLGVAFGAAAFAWLAPRGTGVVPPGTRLSLEIPEHLQLFTSGLENGVPIALHPDGRAVLMLAVPDDGPDRNHAMICVRDLASTEFRVIPGTRDALTRPHVSADGRDVFFVGRIGEGGRRALQRVPYDGSAPPVQVFELPEPWFPDFVPLPGGHFLFLDDQDRLELVDASGQAADPVVIHADRPQSYVFLQFLDAGAVLDARRVLIGGSTFDAQGWSRNMLLVDVGSGKAKTVLRDAGHPHFLPDGDLMFSRGDALLRARFDARRGEISGEPVAVLGGIRTFGGFTPGCFVTSGNGTVVFAPGGRVSEGRVLATLDRSGHASRWDAWPKTYNYNFPPMVSADGRLAAFTVTNARGIDEIWVSDMATPYPRRAVASSELDLGTPVLSADGEWIAFRATGGDSLSGVYVRRTGDSGLGRRVLPTNARPLPTSWLPGAKGLVLAFPEAGHRDLRLVRFEQDPDGPYDVVPLIADGQRNGSAYFSRDGAWLAFSSDRSGSRQAYVTPYRDGRIGPVTPILAGGNPTGWFGDHEVACSDSFSVVKSVTLRFEPAPRVTGVERLFDAADVGLANWSAIPDGRIFGVMQAGEEFRVRRLEIVLGAFRPGR